MPIIAIVDPEMMSSMPKGLTASTGMDALTHAIEGYTTKAAWEMTDMFHLKAIELISKSLRSAVANEKRDAKAWLSASISQVWDFPMSDLESHIPWHTHSVLSMTPHTVLPVQ